MLSRTVLVLPRRVLAQVTAVRHSSDVRVVLLSDLYNYGKAGSEVRVRPGFARNYLLPKKIAVYSTPSNRTKFKTDTEPLKPKTSSSNASKNHPAARGEQAEMPSRSETIAALTKLDTLHLVKQTLEGTNTLRACVAGWELKDLLASEHKIYVRKVNLPAPITTVGDYALKILGVDVKLHVASS